MRERIIIVFVAVAIGLIVTTLIFFVYQQTKSVSQTPNVKSSPTAALTQAKLSYLSVDSPINQAISDRRLIQVKGRTHAQDTIVISSNQEDIVASPTSDGKFSVSITIDAGANIIVTRSIAPTGGEEKDTRIVTYSSEEF